MKKSSNDIFKAIVKDGDPKEDLVGIVAYSIHKVRELEFIDAFKKEKNKSPTSRDMAHFFISSSTKENLTSCRRDATELLDGFINLAMAEKTKEIKNLLPDRIVVGDKDRSFFYGVWQSVVGSIFFVLFTGLVIFFLWSSDKGFGEVVRDIFIEDTSPEPIDKGTN